MKKIIEIWRKLFGPQELYPLRIRMDRADKWQGVARGTIRKHSPECRCGNCTNFRGTPPMKHGTTLGLCLRHSHPVKNVVKITEASEKVELCFLPQKKRFISFRWRFAAKISAHHKTEFAPRESQTAVW